MAWQGVVTIHRRNELLVVAIGVIEKRPLSLTDDCDDIPHGSAQVSKSKCRVRL